MHKYQIIDTIGEGAYGIVLKCKCRDPQSAKTRSTSANNPYQVVAMKQFKDSDDTQTVKKTTMRQIKILKMLDHPNIVHLKEAYRKKGIVYLIFEYVKNNLLEILQKSPNGLDHGFIRTIIYEMCKGLAYLHSLNIIHRDIKPENILIGQNQELKICDFGFARVLAKHQQQQLTDYVATRWYRPPQLLVGGGYSKQIDMWAVGCIMGQLIDGNPMFPGENQLDQLFLIQKCLGPLTPEQNQIFLKNPRFIGTKFPQINSLEPIDKRYLGKFNPKGLNLMKMLLRMNPSDRLTAQQALSHPYFKGMKEQENIPRKISTNNNFRQQSKMTQRQQLHMTTGTHTGIHQKKKHHNAYNPNIQQRQKTEHHHPDSIFSTTKNQKMHHSKKKKEDLFIGSKGATNYKSTNMASKSLGKNKVQKVSQDKNKNRQNFTKTQAGFYVIGGGIIPERNDEDNYHELEQQINNGNMIHANHIRNKIYNIRSPRSKQNPRKQNKHYKNRNTQQIPQDDQVWQSTSQLPILMMASHKSSENRGSKPGAVQAPNIIITNSSFHYNKH